MGKYLNLIFKAVALLIIGYVVLVLLYFLLIGGWIWVQSNGGNYNIHSDPSFGCAGKIFYNTKPMYLCTYRELDSSYRFKKEERDEEEKYKRYFIDVDGCDSSWQTTERTYPVGSQFKFVDAWSQYGGIDAGASMDYLLEDENGVRSLIYSISIDSEQCTFDTFYHRTYKNEPRFEQSVVVDKVWKNFVNRAKPYDGKNDIDLLDTLVNKTKNNTKELKLYFIPEHLHMATRIAYEHRTEIIKGKYKFSYTINTLFKIPAFYTKGKHFSLLSCSDFPSPNLYICTDTVFDSWLKKPYTTEYGLSLKNSIDRDIKDLKDNDIIVVLSLRHFSFNGYLDVVYAASLIKSSGTKLYFITESKAKKYRLKDGVNLVAKNGRVLRHYWFLESGLSGYVKNFLEYYHTRRIKMNEGTRSKKDIINNRTRKLLAN